MKGVKIEWGHALDTPRHLRTAVVVVFIDNSDVRNVHGAPNQRND